MFMPRFSRRLESPKGGLSSAFTLIELLIVVAIIGILAAIAVPNFLEAQVRAKVSRAATDLRSIGTGLESYCVDNHHYPPQSGGQGQGSASRLVLLSTPVAYLTTGQFQDPFQPDAMDADDKDKYYKYRNFLDLVEDSGDPDYPQPVVYYTWGLFSAGPDRGFVKGKNLFDSDGRFEPECIYDPTNGTMSRGDIFRTRKGHLTR